MQGAVRNVQRLPAMKGRARRAILAIVAVAMVVLVGLAPDWTAHLMGHGSDNRHRLYALRRQISEGTSRRELIAVVDGMDQSYVRSGSHMTA